MTDSITRPPADAPPAYLVADLDDLTQHPGGMRLARLLLADPAAAQAYWVQVAEAFSIGRASAPAPALPGARRSGYLVDGSGRATRNGERAALLDRMADATPEAREAIVGLAAQVHSADERRAIQRKALCVHHRSYGSDLSESAAAEQISRDIDRRMGTTIIGTGSKERDRLIDDIILCGDRPSVRTIRRKLSPG